MRPGLVLESRTLSLFDDSSYRWFYLKHYRWPEPDPSDSDTDALKMLLSDETYGFISPLPEDEAVAADMHGPYLRSFITAERFDVIDAATAERSLADWAKEDREPSAAAQRELVRIIGMIRDVTSHFRLQDLGESARVPWNYLGSFHELVLVNRLHGTVTLVIGSSD